MPGKSIPNGFREVSHEEEQKARREWIKQMRKDGRKKHQIDAAEAGWEWAFDTGFDRAEDDSDAARDLADCFMDDDGKKWRRQGGKEACADYVYDGIVAARKLMTVPETPEEREARLKEREELRRQIMGARRD